MTSTPSTQGNKVKALCVGTRCNDVDEFVSTFHRFCDDETFFVATLTMRPVGLETPFSIQLADKRPVLRGLCIVREAWTTADNPFGRPGIRLGIVRLTRESTPVFTRLRANRDTTQPGILPQPEPEQAPAPELVSEPKLGNTLPPRIPAVPAIPRTSPPAIPTARAAAPPGASAGAPLPSFAAAPPPVPVAPAPLVPIDVPPMADGAPAPLPPAIAVARTRTPSTTDPRGLQIAQRLTEIRVPGSEYVLPANPLMNLTDATLEGFVDCTLYEETGQFPLDEVTPLPPRSQAAQLPPIEPPLMSPSQARGGDASGVTASDHAGTQAPIAQAPVFVPAPAHAPQSTMLAAPADDPPAFAPPTIPPNAFEAPPLSGHVLMPAAVFAPSGESPRAGFAAIEPSSLASEDGTGVGAWRQLIGSRRWLVAGASLAGLGVLVLVVVLATRSSGAGDARPAGPSVERVAAAAPAPAPVRAPVASPDAAVIAVDDESPGPQETAGGPPVVGKGPCRIAIVAEPAGAVVQVDGEAAGPAPITIAGPCQKRRLDLSHARYATTTKWASPTEGKLETIDVTLSRPTHAVTVVTQPPGATISIDGRRAGTSPTIVSVMGFQSMSFTAAKTGYQPVTQRIYSKVKNDRVVIKLTSNLFPTKKAPGKTR